MDKLNCYREILQRIVKQHAQYGPHDYKLITLPICDTQTDNYLLVDVGWGPTGRAHWVIVHLRLSDGKVWIERDGIEYGIAQDLLAAGIPKEDIVLAFYRPERRALTGFAAA